LINILKKILRFVQKCDYTIYNTSTLIDSVICIYGSIHVFKWEVVTNVFCDMPNIKIVLVFSNSWQRTTITQSEQMNKLRQFYPFIEFIENSIDEIVEQSISIFENLEDAIWNLKDNMTYKSDVDLFHLIPMEGCTRLSVSFILQTSMLFYIFLCYLLSLTIRHCCCLEILVIS